MSPLDADELRALADAYVAGELSPEQRVTLENRLRTSVEARLSFLAFLEVHAGLAWEYRGAGVELPEATRSLFLVPDSSLPSEIPNEAPSTRNQQPGTRKFLRWALPLAAAVMVLFGIAQMWLPNRPSAVSSATAFAVVKASLHGQWADGREVVVGAPLLPGVWELQNGLVEIETTSGTTLMVEAPARFELVNALYGRLMAGNVVVRMPEGKSGFVMDLPQMRVTDLGTEFGVSVALNGESRVQVFDGKVRAESLMVPGGRELAVGESAVSKADGVLSSEKSLKDRFVRQFPPTLPGEHLGGALYSRSAVDAVRIAPPAVPVVIDADLSEWNRSNAFRSACLPPYDDSHFVEGMMMYDAQHLYISAHVGDPEPMRNVARDIMDFAGGSVIVRVSADRNLGWPLKGSAENATSKKAANPPLPDSLSDRVVSIIMSHDAQSNEARMRLQYGFKHSNAESNPPGWRGAFRKDADGRGYTLEYAIPWSLLNSENDPPRAGDEMAALWMVHWSDADGRLCRGQLVEVTNPQARSKPGAAPATFFRDGSTWGRAIYLPGR